MVCTSVTLEQIGYFQVIINYYFYELGAYERLNLQIINAALVSQNSNFTYNFERSYNFGGIFTGVKYSFGEAVVEGKFEGYYTINKDYIAINGIINYYFSDNFSDPTSKIESLMEARNITRAEAIAILGDSVDEYGAPYKIVGEWQVEFSAIIKPK